MNLINDEEVELIGTKIFNKVSKYFEEVLKNEVTKVDPKKVSIKQVTQIVNFALGMTNAKLINITANLAKEPLVALDMHTAIFTLSERIIYDLYSIDKKNPV